MNKYLERLIWQGKAKQQTQTFGLGEQFVLPIGEGNTGIITKLVFSPFTFQPGNLPGEFITAPLQEIILSDGRKAIKKIIKNFESNVIKGDQAFISQGQSIAAQLYFPFYADAPIFINLNQNNIAIQLGAPFNQQIRTDINPNYEAVLLAAVANGDAIPSLDQQYWQNKLYEALEPYIVGGNILLLVNGLHDAGNINFSRYDWAQPGEFYPLWALTTPTAYAINQGSAAGAGSGNFGLNGFLVPGSNPGFLTYKAARFPRGGMISGNTTGINTTLNFGQNRLGAFIGGGARGWNQTLGVQNDMDRPNLNQSECQTFCWQQMALDPIIDYYIDALFIDSVEQPASQTIPPAEALQVLGRQGQAVLPFQQINHVQFLHTGLTLAEIALLDTAIKSYCASLALPAPVPAEPTGIIQAFITVHYTEITGNHLDRLQ